MTFHPFHSLPYAFGGPAMTGCLKQQTDDFIVDELLPFQPEGSGEHCFLQIEKCHENTEYIARLLARHAGVRQRDIGYAGLKDRHGRTRQWFSVWLPGKADPDWQALESERLQILAVSRHPRKLKRGVLLGNRFGLRIRQLQGDRARLEQQLQAIAAQGFPNYFGEQRFGHQGRNLQQALAMFAGSKVKREQRSIYWSAARAYVFNCILAERVRGQCWSRGLSGEVLQLADSHSFFTAPHIDQALDNRLQTFDLHPTGALWGLGLNPASGEALAIEQAVILAYPELAQGLEAAGLEQDRRALRVRPLELRWQWLADDELSLAFQLPAGSYATVLAREIVAVEA